MGGTTISEAGSGDDGGEVADDVDRLLSLSYDELKRMAAHMMAKERAGHTLQATALVHEAYLRLADGEGNPGSWNSPAHFFSAAAEAMRRILIENARRKKAAKRGGGAAHTELDNSKVAMPTPPDELLAINAALDKLEAEDSRLATVVKLRYFAGMTIPETAQALGSSARTVDRQWECARAWLYR
ncbi:MAG: ECF-type sigma factor, partial [Verrucomicrobiales bacterium]